MNILPWIAPESVPERSRIVPGRADPVRWLAVLLKLLCVALGGMCGASGRFLLSSWVSRSQLASAWPLGTASVNILGCFLFGLIWALGEQKVRLGPELRLAVFTGFLGSFTTFSTYVFESTELFNDGRTLAAFGGLMLQNGLGFACLALGLALGRI